jgi:predicted NBD/HSP70 family sugar kinase
VIAAVDVGRRHMRGTLTDLHGRRLSETLVEKDIDVRSQEAACILDEVLETVILALALASKSELAPYRLADVRSLVVGVPTPVDAEGSAVGMFVARWSGLPLAEKVRRLMQTYAADNDDPLHASLQVEVVKDADLGALAAWRDFADSRARASQVSEANGSLSARRSARRQDVVVFVKASHGIDAGFVCEHHLVTGPQGMTAQIGHMWVPEIAELRGINQRIRDYEPPQRCERCRRRKCLEQLASGEAQLDQLKSLQDTNAPATLDELVSRAEQLDPPTREVITAAATRIGAVLAEAARLVAPTQIVVGGLLAQTGETLMVPLRNAFREFAMSASEPEIVSVDARRIREIELDGAVEYARLHLDVTDDAPVPQPSAAATYEADLR